MSERRPPRPNPMNCSLDLALFSCSLSLASSSSPTSKSCCLFSPQSVYPFGCMFLYLYLCFSFFSSFFQLSLFSICLPVCLTVHLCMYLPAYLYILSNFYLSTDICPLVQAHLSTYPSTHIHQYIHPPLSFPHVSRQYSEPITCHAKATLRCRVLCVRTIAPGVNGPPN